MLRTPCIERNSVSTINFRSVIIKVGTEKCYEQTIRTDCIAHTETESEWITKWTLPNTLCVCLCVTSSTTYTWANGHEGSDQFKNRKPLPLLQNFRAKWALGFMLMCRLYPFIYSIWQMTICLMLLALVTANSYTVKRVWRTRNIHPAALHLP